MDTEFLLDTGYGYLAYDIRPDPDFCGIGRFIATKVQIKDCSIDFL